MAWEKGPWSNNQILPTRPMLPPQPGTRSARWPHLHPMPGGRSAALYYSRSSACGDALAAGQKAATGASQDYRLDEPPTARPARTCILTPVVLSNELGRSDKFIPLARCSPSEPRHIRTNPSADHSPRHAIHRYPCPDAAPSLQGIRVHLLYAEKSHRGNPPVHPAIHSPEPPALPTVGR